MVNRVTCRAVQRGLVACLVALLLAGGGGAAAQPSQVTEEQIDQTIGRLKQILYDNQDPETGGWFGVYDKSPAFDNPKYDGGLTMLATYALLSTGESPQINPRVAKALRYIETLQRKHGDKVMGTYVVGMRAHVWAQLAEQYETALQRDAKLLLNGVGPAGDFSYLLNQYEHKPASRAYDNSTNQYGVLGLWEAAKRDVRVPDRFWKKAVEHVLSNQHSNGGWSYTALKKPTATMTTAGLTVLFVAQQQLTRDQDTPNPTITRAINRGLEFLDDNFKVNENPYSGNGYFIYGIERVGLAAGRSEFGGQDWFDGITQHIVKRVRRGDVDDQVVNPCFYLMFLSRGRVPVTINKLSLPGQAWSNRPNDVFYLTKHLSEAFEQEQNWKVVPVDWTLERWLGSPITYVSVDGPLVLTDAQKQQIKTYLDLGGLLLVNPENAFERVLRSVEKLGQELYPELEMKPIKADHPLLNLWKPVRRPPRIHALHDGTRDLIVVPGADWGRDWQRGPNRRNEDVFNAAGNLLLTATGNGRLASRLVGRYPFPAEDPEGPEKTVAVVALGGARADGLWEYLRRDLGRRGVARIEAMPQSLDELGEPVQRSGGVDVRPDVVHLVGVDAVELNGEAIERISRFAEQGGTVFVESLGGRGDFAAGIERQLSASLAQPSERLSTFDPPLAPDEAQKHTHDLARVTYQVFSVRNFAADDKPRLTGLRVNDRPAILISAEDVSLAAMGVRYWGVHGYSVDSARKLLSNVLLYAEPPVTPPASH